MRVRFRLWGGLVCLAMASGANADMVARDIEYSIGEVTFRSTLVFDDATKAPRPGLVMVPNWLGPNEANLEQAKLVAGDRYVVLMADVFGVDVRPTNAAEAGQAVAPLRADRALLRQRVARAVEELLAQAGNAPLDPQRLAAIGFCFGGGAVLELARSGADVAGVVSFHGNLDTPDPGEAQNIRAKVLVLHGADDPAVPPAQVQDFEAEMKSAPGVDWQLVSFGGAVHSFTDPDANVPGRNEYHPVVARRAYTMMHNFMDELFAAP